MKSVHAKFTASEYALLKSLADDDRRSVTSYVSVIVQKHLDAVTGKRKTPLVQAAPANPVGLSTPKAPTPAQAKAASAELAARLDSLFDDEDEPTPATPVPHNPFAREGGRTGPLTEKERQIMLSAYDSEPSPEDSDEFPNSLPS
jgi:hypothetical protein